MTRFTRLVGVRHPVMQDGGLGPYKTVRLAAAVATAGGLGTVSIPGISEEANVHAVVEAVRDPAIAKRLRAITTSAGPPAAARELIAGSGLIHFHKVGGTSQALRTESTPSSRRATKPAAIRTRGQCTLSFWFRAWPSRYAFR